jgi:HAD superfamily hydrolase (TIGR01509 family)
MAVDVLKARHVPVKKVFSKVFISSKMHLAKPDPAGYRYVSTHMKMKPSEILMIDDRLENVKAAKKFGMQGIVFKDTAQLKRAIKMYDLV